MVMSLDKIENQPPQISRMNSCMIFVCFTHLKSKVSFLGRSRNRQCTYISSLPQKTIKINICQSVSVEPIVRDILF
jgi:hypothetical protein